MKINALYNYVPEQILRGGVFASYQIICLNFCSSLVYLSLRFKQIKMLVNTRS